MMHPAGPILAALLVALAGCVGPLGADNLLTDPGFEDGGQTWFWFEGSKAWPGPFEVVSLNDTVPEHVRSGQHALKTLAGPTNRSHPTTVAGAIQNLTADELDGELPETLSGHYRVATWEPGNARAYVQVVISLYPPSDGTGTPCPFPASLQTAPCQIAYPLTGIDQAPFVMANRQFVPLGQGTPMMDQWVEFEASPSEDFEELWDARPENVSELWVYLETRYEYPEDVEEREPVELEVYWDDVFLGG